MKLVFSMTNYVCIQFFSSFMGFKLGHFIFIAILAFFYVLCLLLMRHKVDFASRREKNISSPFRRNVLFLSDSNLTHKSKEIFKQFLLSHLLKGKQIYARINSLYLTVNIRTGKKKKKKTGKSFENFPSKTRSVHRKTHPRPLFVKYSNVSLIYIAT